MIKMKKVLACVLAATLMVTSVVPAFAAAAGSPGGGGESTNASGVEPDEKTNGITTELNTKEDGTCELAEVEKTNKKNIVISATYTVDNVTYTTTTINKGAFKNCNQAKTIELAETITSVAKNAITAKNCPNLKVIVVKTIPKNIKSFHLPKKLIKQLNMITIPDKWSAKRAKKFRNTMAELLGISRKEAKGLIKRDSKRK